MTKINTTRAGMLRNCLAFIILLCLNGCENDFVTGESITPRKQSTPMVPRVLVNGVPLAFKEAAPEFNGNTVMVPAAETLRRIGYTTQYEVSTNTFVSTKGAKKITLALNKNEAVVHGTKVALQKVPYLKNGTLMVEPTLFEYISAILAEYDQGSASVQLYYYDELDYGLYFYGHQPDGHQDAVGCQKFVPGQNNRYFDPDKPTIIWLPGWQKDGVINKHRPSFHLNKIGISKFVQNDWIEKGWNVAMYYWVPLADELFPFDAESKINAATNNTVGMRWKKADGSYVTEDTPTIPVAALFAAVYKSLVSVQNNPKIRLAGSSFGGQVALHGAERLLNDGVRPLPSRIALLDMAWTHNYVNNQKLYTNRITARAVKALSPEVPIAYFRTSILTTFFTPKELIEEAAFQEMVFKYASVTDFEFKHTAITRHYFWSIAHAPPVARDHQNRIVGEGLSASTSLESLKNMMGSRYHWQHIEGNHTFDPGDDVFERQDGPI